MKVANFKADITPPMNHPLCGGLVKPVIGILHPLSARGIVLYQDNIEPIVICALDLCELGSTSYLFFRKALADACGIRDERVLINTCHQHDAPIVDNETEKILIRAGLNEWVTDENYFSLIVTKTAESLSRAIPVNIDKVGSGLGMVKNYASNRRIINENGKLLTRMSNGGRYPEQRDAPEGLIDPNVKSLVFYSNGEPVSILTSYSSHPQSYYGTGLVSYDTIGIARRKMKDKFQIPITHCNGCGGNVAPGKYNDGSEQSRINLSESLFSGMEAALISAKPEPMCEARFVCESFNPTALVNQRVNELEFESKLMDKNLSFADRWLHARGLALKKCVNDGMRFEIQGVGFTQKDDANDGNILNIIQIPGEPFIEYCFYAKEKSHPSPLMTFGYSNLSFGYLPTDRAYSEGGYEPEWAFFPEGLEKPIHALISSVIKKLNCV